MLDNFLDAITCMRCFGVFDDSESKPHCSEYIISLFCIVCCCVCEEESDIGPESGCGTSPCVGVVYDALTSCCENSDHAPEVVDSLSQTQTDSRLPSFFNPPTPPSQDQRGADIPQDQIGMEASRFFRNPAITKQPRSAQRYLMVTTV